MAKNIDILKSQAWLEMEQILNTPAGRKIVGVAPEAISIMNGVAPEAMSMKGQRRHCSPQELERRYSLIKNCDSVSKLTWASLNPAEQELRRKILANCRRREAGVRNYSSIRQLEQSAGVAITPETIRAAKADFYRATAKGEPVPAKAERILSAVNPLRAIPATGNTGQNFLPATLADEIFSEPFATNPLREIISISNIRGLELPKIAFKLDDDNFIDDAATAQEMELTGNIIAFERNKFKVMVRISDTVLHGSDLDLVGYVENVLKSAVASVEKKSAFATSPLPGLEHMSFYNGEIETVSGVNLRDAIMAAIADLHEVFREGAAVVMSRADYMKIVFELANGSLALFGVQPERIIGKPVVFCDAAVIPIVGDFKYFRLNYDGEPFFDNDKEIVTGNYIWALTAWFDQRRMLDSAFRLATVEEA